MQNEENESPDPQAELVPVLETTEAGLLPIARVALEQEGIEYVVQNRGFADQILGHRSSMTVGETDTPLVILVRADDAPRANAVLHALTTADSSSTVAPPPAPGTTAPLPLTADRAHPVQLTDVENGRSVGALTEAQFAALAEHLVRESDEDDDYYFDEATLTLLSDKGVDPAVIARLREALAGRPDLTVRWTKAS